MKWITTALLITGGLLCCLNFYLSFLRYPIHRLTGHKKEDYKWTSGIPLFGSLFVALSLLSFWRVSWVLVLSLILIVIDTGGIHWFLGVMLYQEILKKNKASNQAIEAIGGPRPPQPHG